MKRCIFKTLGCKVNQYETQAIRENFLSCGYEEVSFGERADVCVINTCTVTKMSDRKSRHLIRKAIRSNPKGTVIVTGCYAERNQKDIAGIKGVDFVVPNNQKNRIVDIIRRKNNGKRPSAEGRFFLKISSFKDHSRAFVKIQDGCNNFCSFCKVPYVRGRSLSRDLKAIVEEVKRLVERGFRELVLSGICLGAYGADLEGDVDIVDVIEAIEKLPGGFRIRLSSIEPNMVSEKLIGKMAHSKCLCSHLHIPLQSGDEEILKKMNRSYSVDEYKKLVERIRNKIPKVSLTTDVMVGFPGEKETIFLNTLNTLKEISPSRVHIFPYSLREETAASYLKDVVPKDKIQERMRILRSLAAAFSLRYRDKFVARLVDVLVESKRDKKSGLLTGYTDTYIKVSFQGSNSLYGEIVPVKITKLSSNLTLGVLSENEWKNIRNARPICERSRSTEVPVT